MSAKHRRVKPGIGDVLEVPTRNGLRYGQYTHEHPEFGSLLRVIEGAHKIRPSDLARLVRGRTTFVTFFPIAEAVRRGIFEIVGRTRVPGADRSFPLFKAAGSRDVATRAGLEW